jgi:hypothetical protein
LPSPSSKLQNFKSVQTKPKFCRQLLKVPKAKPKVNKVHRNGTKARMKVKMSGPVFVAMINPKSGDKTIKRFFFFFINFDPPKNHLILV